MKLADLYRDEGIEGLRRLAAATGANDKYIYQCATGRKVPSPALAKALIVADPRLTLDDLYADIAIPVDIDGGAVIRGKPAVPGREAA